VSAADGPRQQRGALGVIAPEGQLQPAVVVALHRDHGRIGREEGRRRRDGRLVAQDAGAQHRTGTQARLDVGYAAGGEDASPIDDRDARAQLLELGEDVAADEDRLAQRAQLAEQLTQLDAGARVEAGGRFVEEQHGRVVDERVGEAEPLLHASAEGLDGGLTLVGEVDQLK